MLPRQPGRYQIEVYPHAATVKLFGLERIVKYKRGRRADRACGLAQLCALILQLEGHDPSLRACLPEIPVKGDLKPSEDVIDAVLCAYVAAHWWKWAGERNRIYGTRADGYIVVPDPGGSAVPG